MSESNENVQQAATPGNGDGWSPARVKALRLRMRVNQTVFGDAVGVTRQTVGEWEKGESVPSALSQQALDDLEREHQPAALPGVREPVPAAYAPLRNSLAYWLGRLEEAGGVLEDAAARHQRIRADLAAALEQEAIPVAGDRARAVQSGDAAARGRGASGPEAESRPQQKRA